jgi:hypothetical protein
MTALMACCLRGFSIGNIDIAGRSNEAKEDRKKCVEILLFESQAA